VEQVVVAVVIVSTVSCAVCVGMLLWIRHRMRRFLRVRPRTRTQAPTGWALSTSEPARLHRRLRRVAASARLSGSNGDTTTAALAVQVEDEAVRLETCLVALSRVWRTDRDARRQMTAQITELEHLTVRLATNAAAISRPAALTTGAPDSLSELRERLDALDDARRELSTVERQAGVRFG
jgi:DNA repair ATPase RecN